MTISGNPGRLMLLIALFTIGVAFPAAADEPQHGKLQFQFIGNTAFKITDGDVTLVTDFPYRSGASGSMTYDIDDVELKGDVICLVTHSHIDHFDQVIFRENAYGLIAPETVTGSLGGYRIFPFEDEIVYRSLTVKPERTPHERTIHYSYLVIWHGLRLYFAGDTGRADALLAAKDLDIAFVAPWLLKTVKEAGAEIDAKKVIVYHHRTHDLVVEYQNRIVPKQGDSFTLDF